MRNIQVQYWIFQKEHLKSTIQSERKQGKSIPGETGEDMTKIEGYLVSPSRGVHSTFKILFMSSCFGQ